MRRTRYVVALLVLTLLLAACTPKSIKDTEADLSRHFGKFRGTFKLHDLTADTQVVHNAPDLDRQYPPASTYKILHAMIALKTGVLSGAEAERKWDGTVHPVKEWNRDHTLRSAVANSVVWYFRAVAREIGPERMQQHLDKVGYGNRQIGQADYFWLDGSLRISVNEQVAFLTRLYREELPFDPAIIRTVKELITVSSSDSLTYVGKTGTYSPEGKEGVSWYVGYVVNQGKPLVFALKLEGQGVSGAAAKAAAESILKELRVLP